MSIFLALMRKHIRTELINYTGSSVAAEKSLWNIVATAASNATGIEMGVNPTLSEDKRSVAEIIIQNLYQISLEKKEITTKSDEEDADEEEQTVPKKDSELGKEIRKLLRDKQKIANQKARDKYKSEGTLGPKIDNCLKLCKLLDERMTQVGLSNIPITVNMETNEPITTDPFILFRYHMAQYIFKNVHEEVYPKWSLWGSSRKLTSEKEELVKLAITKLTKDLDTLDKQHPDYQDTRKSRVLELIKKLREGNLKKVEDHSTSATLPVQVALFTAISIDLGKFGPAEGYLKECLDAAEHSIAPEIAADKSPVYI